ncbi:MAG: DNA starvation/stationary phase protection protein [Aerococcus sp.]|nr:DNA starvation/stationary phase protection protein [Aerococcus sp.]
MTTRKERQEQLAQEQAYKEHIHHTKINAAAIIDHILANSHTLHVKWHQYHWYVKGRDFYSLHEVFESLYNDNEKWFDALAKRVLASGFKPASTTEEFQQYTTLNEAAEDKYLSGEEMAEQAIEDLRSNREFVIRAIRLAQAETDDALEEVLIDYKDHLDMAIWQLQAFLGKEALEGDDYIDEE